MTKTEALPTHRGGTSRRHDPLLPVAAGAAAFGVCCGLPLLGSYRSVRGGHKLNHAVLTALLADRTAWRVVESDAQARRPRLYAETGSGMVRGLAAAYGPDVS